MNYNFTFLLLSVLLASNGWLASPTYASADDDRTFSVLSDSLFEESANIIPAYSFPSISWGDYDNDGDLDFAIGGALDANGDTFADSSAVDIYQNENGQFTRLATDVFYGLHVGTVLLLDIDLDGDLDLIATGQNYVDIFDYQMTVYQNDNGNFSAGQSLPGTIFSSLNAGDYDLDGDLDLLVSGAVQGGGGASVRTLLYTNDAGNFSDSGISFPGVQNGDAQFADFDGDGRLDVLLMGVNDDGDYLLHYYRQTTAGYVLEQELGGMYLGAFSISDYDNDGDLDFAVMGDDVNDDYAAFLYPNEGTQFGIPDTLLGIDNSSGPNPVDWGDYDNDGLRDLVMVGNDEDFEDRTFLYRNNNGQLERTFEGLRDLGGNTAAGFADFDGDRDLDLLLAGSYFNDDYDYLAVVIPTLNTVDVVNEAPQPPSATTATFTALDTLRFDWELGTDDRTPDAGLYYWLRVSRLADGQLLADYPVYGNTWSLNLPRDDYAWSVRSVDASDVFSVAVDGEIRTTSVSQVAVTPVAVVPNPVVDDLVLRGVRLEGGRIEIYNALGQLVERGRLRGQRYAVGGLAPGAYSLRAYDEAGTSYVAKFIVH